MTKKIFKHSLCAIILCMIAIIALSPAAFAAYGATVSSLDDGTYTVSVSNSMSMGASTVSSSALLEKSGDNYYVSFSFDESALSDITMSSDIGCVGCMESESGGWVTYTYTVSEESLSSTYPFSATVKAMGRKVSFNLGVDLSSASKTSDEIANRGERPAQFVPEITTEAAAEYEASMGATLIIPYATAVMCGEACGVTASTLYISGGEQTEAELEQTDGGYKITLANAGEYRVIYKASSSLYKTSLGNDAYTEYVITVTSTTGGSSLAKFTDTANALPEGAGLVASRISSGSSVYDLAKSKMATIADNFEVFGVEFIASDGTSAEFSGSVSLYLKADPTYERNSMTVFLMSDDGSLKKLSCEGYGRYVKIETSSGGTFIVCVEGVAFVMPMWGYALIAVAAVIVLAAAITAIIILRKRHKKKEAALYSED